MCIEIKNATRKHLHHANTICQMIEEATQKRGTGIAKRSVEYVQQKIEQGKAVIALDKNKIIGFCYIESWSHGQYVANSGLIVHPDYRKTGLAKQIKAKIFRLSREKFPKAKIFGITTSGAVMKINSELGYKPVVFSELTDDKQFWAGCQSCKNYSVLRANDYKMCLCTAMLFNPEAEKPKKHVRKSKIPPKIKT